MLRFGKSPIFPLLNPYGIPSQKKQALKQKHKQISCYMISPCTNKTTQNWNKKTKTDHCNFILTSTKTSSTLWFGKFWGSKKKRASFRIGKILWNIPGSKQIPPPWLAVRQVTHSQTAGQTRLDGLKLKGESCLWKKLLCQTFKQTKQVENNQSSLKQKQNLTW